MAIDLTQIGRTHVGLLAALFWRAPIEGMSFAVGATLLLVACVLEAVRHEWRGAKGVR